MLLGLRNKFKLNSILPDWRPSASIATLRKRNQILQTIRAFFAERDVMEVETPSLSQHSVTDVNLSAFKTEFVSPISPDRKSLFLQTSPEYAMKRLLCAGSGCIFQLAKAFRNEEAGRFHNPEFTMLEWYRIGFDHLQLIDEIDGLLQSILNCPPLTKNSYQELFIQHCDFDPLVASLEDLQQVASDFGFAQLAENETSRDLLLQLLFSHVIEPKIGLDKPIAVTAFPASQAALARLDPKDERVSERFEIYYQGIELANGFHELNDIDEQYSRFTRENAERQASAKDPVTLDPYFLSALHHGLPDCAGVALGVDRLVMLAIGADSLSETMAFDVQRA